MTFPTPTSNKTASLHTPAGGRFSVVVLHQDDDEVAVGRPTSLTPTEELAPGAELHLTWSGEAGQQLIPIQVLETSTEAGVQTWKLQATGPGVELDRRAYPRVGLNVPMDLGIVGHLTTLTTCLLVDLSEVGLRTRLRRAEAEQLGPELELAIRFTADGVDFNMLGRALRMNAVGAMTDLVDLVVLFDLTPESRTLLRTALAAADEF